MRTTTAARDADWSGVRNVAAPADRTAQLDGVVVGPEQEGAAITRITPPTSVSLSIMRSR